MKLIDLNKALPTVGPPLVNTRLLEGLEQSMQDLIVRQARELNTEGEKIRREHRRVELEIIRLWKPFQIMRAYEPIHWRELMEAYEQGQRSIKAEGGTGRRVWVPSLYQRAVAAADKNPDEEI